MRLSWTTSEPEACGWASHAMEDTLEYALEYYNIAQFVHYKAHDNCNYRLIKWL